MLKTSLILLLVLSGCLTADADPAHDSRLSLAGTWERVDAAGTVLERVTFQEDGTFDTMTVRTGWDGTEPPRMTPRGGTYSADATRLSIVMNTGESGLGSSSHSDGPPEITFTYYASQDMFVRNALLRSYREAPSTVTRPPRSTLERDALLITQADENEEVQDYRAEYSRLATIAIVFTFIDSDSDFPADASAQIEPSPWGDPPLPCPGDWEGGSEPFEISCDGVSYSFAWEEGIPIRPNGLPGLLTEMSPSSPWRDLALRYSRVL